MELFEAVCGKCQMSAILVLICGCVTGMPSSRFVPCRDYEETFRCSDFDLFNAKVFGF